jgi:hypothetical protein
MRGRDTAAHFLISDLPLQAGSANLVVSTGGHPPRPPIFFEPVFHCFDLFFREKRSCVTHCSGILYDCDMVN